MNTPVWLVVGIGENVFLFYFDNKQMAKGFKRMVRDLHLARKANNQLPVGGLSFYERVTLPWEA